MTRRIAAAAIALVSLVLLTGCDTHSASDCQRLRGYYVQDDEGWHDRCIVHDSDQDILYDAWDR